MAKNEVQVCIAQPQTQTPLKNMQSKPERYFLHPSKQPCTPHRFIIMAKNEVQVCIAQPQTQTPLKNMQSKSPSGIFFILPHNRAHHIGL